MAPVLFVDFPLLTRPVSREYNKSHSAEQHRVEWEAGLPALFQMMDPQADNNNQQRKKK